MFSLFKNLTSEKKVFYIFLLVHLVVWSCIGLIRTVMPTDALEGIFWGMQYDFGTPKHPPLAGWLSYIAYVPFKCDFLIYFMSQLFIVTGFIYIYKLARNFLDESKSMLSVIVLEGCWCYSYITGYYGFNPDAILLCMLPVISYYFYNCMKYNKKSDWIILGIVVGLGFLNKYQTAFLILPMAIWAYIFNRDTFKNKYFYLAILLAFLIFLPHLLWMIKYDFFPLMYFEGELSATSWFDHITAPLMFLCMQIVAIIGTLLIYSLLLKKSGSKFEFIKEYKKEDFWFLILLGLLPVTMHFLMGIYSGGNMRARWGYEFWFMIGILLFYFIPCKIDRDKFKFTIISAYVVMLIVFLSLGTLLTVEQNYRSRYPVSHIMSDMNKIWQQKFHTDIKYVGGYIEWTLPLTIYGEQHPICIQDTHGYPDPWLDIEDMKKSGVLVIDRTIGEMEEHVRGTISYLPKDYKITPVEYKFFVHNALNMPREYTIYYFIIPPNAVK